MERLYYSGALHDPVAAIVFCNPVKVDYTVVAGKIIVQDGQVMTIDLPKLVEQHNLAARRLLLSN